MEKNYSEKNKEMFSEKSSLSEKVDKVVKEGNALETFSSAKKYDTKLNPSNVERLEDVEINKDIKNEKGKIVAYKKVGNNEIKIFIQYAELSLAIYNVPKIYINGNKSNIRGLKKYLKHPEKMLNIKEGPNIKSHYSLRRGWFYTKIRPDGTNKVIERKLPDVYYYRLPEMIKWLESEEFIILNKPI